MRKLRQIIKISEPVEGYMEIPPQGAEIMALDDGGELWFGVMETSDDGRRVVDWTPVQLPPDGMSFSEEQLSFWDKMERDAREKYKASLDGTGEAETLETKE